MMCGRGLCEIYGWEEGKDISKLSQCGEQSERRGGGGGSFQKQTSQPAGGWEAGKAGVRVPWQALGTPGERALSVYCAPADFCTIMHPGL